MSETSRRTYNLTQAGNALGLAPSTVRQRILDGRLEAEKDGGRWIIYADVIEHYRLSRRQQNGASSSVRIAATRPARAADLTPEDEEILRECGIEF